SKLWGDEQFLARRFMDSAFGCLRAQHSQISPRRHPRLLLEESGKVSGTHVCERGHVRHAGDRLKPIGQTRLNLSNGLPICESLRQCRAELRLIALSLKKYDEVARDRLRNLASAIFLDQAERKIDSRGDPCRGPYGSVAYEDGLSFHLHIRKVLRESLQVAPVRGGAPAAKQPGLGKVERTGADRSDAPASCRGILKPGQQGLIACSGENLVAS